jgi:hypothetical protein
MVFMQTVRQAWVSASTSWSNHFAQYHPDPVTWPPKAASRANRPATNACW